eukprot:6141518-Alexandrium_andersonii.AAC.1
MSASLVGSEMCIRDRLRATTADKRHVGPAPPFAHGQVRSQAGPFGAAAAARPQEPRLGSKMMGHGRT